MKKYLYDRLLYYRLIHETMHTLNVYVRMLLV